MYPLSRIIATFCLINLAVCFPKESFNLEGVFIATFTPMDAEGNLNLTNIPAYAKYLKESGFDGVLLSGALSGEGPNLCVREKKSLYDAWMMYAKPLRLRVILQIGGSSLPDILELAAYANVLNVDAMLVFPTLNYYEPSVEELTYLMKDISKAAPAIPFLYFDDSEWSNVYVDMPGFVKSAVDHIPQFRGVLTDFPTSLEILATNEVPKKKIFLYGYILTTAAVPYGFDTFVTLIGNIAPRLYLDMIRSAQNRNFEAAKELQLKVIALFRDITAQSYFISALKIATELTTGILLGNPREPLPKIDEDGREYIISILKKYDLTVA